MKKFVLAASLGCGLGIWAAIQFTGPVLAQSNSDKASVYEQLDLFGDIFERIRAQYVEEVDEADLIEAAINGMLTSLDPIQAIYHQKMQKKCVFKLGVRLAGWELKSLNRMVL